MKNAPTLCLISTGEVFELKQALASAKKAEKRDAIKKIIANMTVGKDVRYFIFPTLLVFASIDRLLPHGLSFALSSLSITF